MQLTRDERGVCLSCARTTIHDSRHSNHSRLPMWMAIEGPLKFQQFRPSIDRIDLQYCHLATEKDNLMKIHHEYVCVNHHEPGQAGC